MDSNGLSAEVNARLKIHVEKGTFGATPKASGRLGGGQWHSMFTINYNGEKNYGEMGPVKEYIPEYYTLRARSWQLFLDSDIAQTVLGKYVTWVIGRGLKLQAEPEKLVLSEEGINLDTQKFSKTVEARFKLFSKSPDSDYARTRNLNILEEEGFKNAIVGGDLLVILRFENDDSMNVQLIDGGHVISPIYGSEFYPYVKKNGNRIENGIELNDRNEHIAYYVRKVSDRNIFTWETQRVPVMGAGTGLKMAWMVYGSKYRLDNHRGIPLLSVVFETAKKLDRYKEAVVGGAEERAKIAWYIEHELNASGQNPILKQTALARDLNYGSGDVPITTEGNILQNRVAATEGKMMYNLPPGSKMGALEAHPETNFENFFTKNIELFCAAAQIPPEVATSKYNSNFSASRAALKDWENSLNVRRTNFGFQFLQPIYNAWLESKITLNKIIAPGYLKARLNEPNSDIVEAYRTVRWVGAAVPHIDPMKEVQAERLKLGAAGAAVPFTTAEQSTEILNGGDYDSNLEQFGDELRDSISKGVKIPEPPAKPGAPAPKPKKNKRPKP